MRLGVVLVFMLVLAGCSSSADKSPATEGGSTSESPRVSTGGGPAIIPGNASAPPQWQVGQAWTWNLHAAAAGEDYKAKSVVLSTTPEGFDIGAANAIDMTDLYPFHLVPLGAIDGKDLAWQAHGLPVRLLRFPLVDGDTFTADFWAAPGAQVKLTAMNVTGPRGPEPGFRSVVSYAAGGTFLEAEYATARGQFVRVASFFGAAEPFAEVKLLEDFVGEKGVGFRVTDVVRINARSDTPTTLQPQVATIPDGPELLLLACFASGQGTYSAMLTLAGSSLLSVGCQGPATEETHYQRGYLTQATGTMTLVLAPIGAVALTTEVFAIDTSAP